jgi:hypothetical protein
MARGWESKSVADQIEEGESRRSESRVVKSTEDLALQQKRDSLVLSRSRLLQQLERASNTAHREVLLRGLNAIDNEIEELGK